jgi:N-acetyl-gamma-glutamyl-phosphate reductase
VDSQYTGSDMIDVAVLGATGYTALELVKILLRHPDVRVTVATSRQDGQPPISTVHPSLVGRLEIPLEDLDPAAVASRASCVFSCLPHTASASGRPSSTSALTTASMTPRPTWSGMAWSMSMRGG